MVLAGSVISMATTIGQSAALAAGIVTPLTLFLPGFFITFAQGIALPFAQAGAMAIVPRLAGTASGIGVFLQLLLAGISTQGYGWLANGTVWPLIFVTGLGSAFVLIAGMLPWLAKRRENNFS
jgi:DHA1 family bicyclomycin/chloramphenicol resistance-like MFS transporter